MGEMAISRDDWLRALAEVAPVFVEDTSAVTVKEFAAQFDLSRHVAEHKLAALVAAGRAEIVKKRIQRNDGNTTTVNAYRLITP